MPDNPIDEEVLDLNEFAEEQVNERIRTLFRDSRAVLLTKADRRDFLCIGLNEQGHVRIDGDVGDFCFYGNQSAQIEVEGDAGNGCGQWQQSGSIVIHGQAGSAFGCFCQGGWLAAYGNAGTRCAAGLKNGEVIVRGSVAEEAAFGMHGGTLVIGGAAGHGLGRGMQGGTIFIRGDVASLDSELEEFRMKESDRFKLGLLMLKAGIKVAGKDFRGYRKIPK